MKRAAELFLGVLFASQAAAGLPLRVSVEMPARESGAGKISGILTLTPQKTTLQAELPEALKLPLEAPGEVRVDLNPGLGWKADFSAEGVWTEAQTFTPEEVKEKVTLRAFRSGTIQGRLVRPREEEPGEVLAVRLRSVPLSASPGATLDTTVACPVRDGLLDCPLPAGSLDLRLRGEEAFAPIYLWGIRVEPRKTTDLGDLHLRRGASVSGWVETAEGRPPSLECRLKLVPETAAPVEDLVVRERVGNLSLEARPNEKGFFQLTGVPPGRYVLTASQPGFAPAKVQGIDVRPDLESQVIQRLVLAKPVSFQIALDPPVEPYGAAWDIHLYKRNASSEVGSEQHRGRASKEGIWRSPGLSPGVYELVVSGELKERWYSEFIEVEPGEPDLRIEIPVVRVKGLVRRGREPLAATLWFSQEKGRRLRFDSDEEGRFHGLFAGEGTWGVQLESEEEGLRIALDPVEVRLPKGKDTADVEVRIPDTTLVGEVVDEQGRSVPGADLLASGLERKRVAPNAFRTDDNGKFSIRGLPAGPLVLRAALELEGAESDWIQTTLTEGMESPWVRLVLRTLKIFEGRVVSVAGGVPGAKITASPPFNGRSATSIAEDVSGPDGRFRLQLPSDTVALNVLVFSSGYALRMGTVPVVPGQPLEVTLETTGGTLVVESSPEGPSPFLVHGGTFTFLKELQGWARANGVRSSEPGRMVVPNVESGLYSVCVGGTALATLREGGEPPAAHCASGALAPHGELVLRVPSPVNSR
jgi:hypothetical protein